MTVHQLEVEASLYGYEWDYVFNLLKYSLMKSKCLACRGRKKRLYGDRNIHTQGFKKSRLLDLFYTEVRGYF